MAGLPCLLALLLLPLHASEKLLCVLLCGGSLALSGLGLCASVLGLQGAN